MPTRNNPTKRLLFNTVGVVISVVPVTVSILSYFPLWAARRNASLISGISLILILLALLPFFKHVKHFLKSPSAPIMWLIVFITFLFLSRIADEVTVISLVGFITNLIGALFFKLARKYDGEKKNEGQS